MQAPTPSHSYTHTLPHATPPPPPQASAVAHAACDANDAKSIRGLWDLLLAPVIVFSDLFRDMELRKVKLGPGVTPLRLAELVARFGAQKQNLNAQATWADGFWLDHFTYSLDLIDNYLRIWPEGREDCVQDVYIYSSETLCFCSGSSVSLRFPRCIFRAFFVFFFLSFFLLASFGSFQYRPLSTLPSCLPASACLPACLHHWLRACLFACFPRPAGGPQFCAPPQSATRCCRTRRCPGSSRLPPSPRAAPRLGGGNGEAREKAGKSREGRRWG